jgi:antitoxin StbD
MFGSLASKEIINSIIPISRFNKGEAGKIFNELKKSGIKVVLKNNTPAGILMSPDVYEEMVDTIEDYRLLFEAEQRIRNAKAEDFISAEEALKELDIEEADLAKIDADN